MKRKEEWLEPPERFELSTPGLQDQCSNPWATEACGMHVPVYDCFYFSIFYSLWQLPILRDSLPPVYLKPAFNWSLWSLASAPHGPPF